MSTERAKPFVAWTTAEELASEAPLLAKGDEREKYGFDVPVVVTPLLPDDPRPGETWDYVNEHGLVIPGLKITGAPYVYGADEVCIGTRAGAFVLSHLRRPPVLKTFSMTWTAPNGLVCVSSVQAESREAALAKLAESLEEVAE